ncbi:MAG: NB-ARC domain-containing protein [Ardenticatenaceae bacterium]
MITQLTKDLHQSLRKWHKNSRQSSDIDYLHLYHKERRKTRNAQEATQEVIFKGLEALQIKYPKHADLLRSRFIECVIVREIANQDNISKSYVHNMQASAIRYLAITIDKMEQKLVVRRERALQERLDPPIYAALVGIEAHLQHLHKILLSPEGPMVVCICGLGGIGKTTLADRLARKVFPQGPFGDFGWVSARQNHFRFGATANEIRKPALTVDALVDGLIEQLMGVSPASFSPGQGLQALENRLKEDPHLIVIDNLETVLDLETLLPTLRRLANPSKFVLTSRKGLYAEPDVYHFPVPELNQSDTLKMIREDARIRNLKDLREASDEELIPIYETVGGNPLALRLVIGQTYVHNLDLILKDLVSAHGEKADSLYNYIYRRAWDNLNQLARHVFLLMPLVADQGGDFNQVKAVTALNSADLHPILERLITLNLIEIKGAMEQRRYTLHQLTRTFLLEQVLKWK